MMRIHLKSHTCVHAKEKSDYSRSLAKGPTSKYLALRVQTDGSWMTGMLGLVYNCVCVTVDAIVYSVPISIFDPSFG
jgi:hypothetical protein